ncbi:MAG: hypothetical protein EBU08_15480, partial [Micrococcales bacterium]|nr:hypothetical protein [Micrococcales bacterium]
NASENLNNIFAAKNNTTTLLFASGATKLFRYNSATTNLTDVSKVGGYSTATGERTFFTQFGNVVLAANGTNKLQAWTIGTSTVFADVAAAAPTAHYVTVVRDFVVAANELSYPNRVYWSDINDETDWTPSATSQSDHQDLADGGDVMGISGGEFGLILTERSVVRMSYIGSPFFLSDDGFYSCDGQAVKSIGSEKVDKFFFADVNLSKLNEMSCAVDPVKKLVIWNYTDNFAQKKQLIYNILLGKWSYAETTASYINNVYTPTLALENLDIYGTLDSLGVSLDSRQWAGGALLLAGVTSARAISFTGQRKTGSLITGDFGLPNTRSVATLAKPIIDNGSGTVSIASRVNLDGSLTFSTAASADSENRVGIRSAGRYHRIKTVPTGLWTNALAVDVDIAPQGNR